MTRGIFLVDAEEDVVFDVTVLLAFGVLAAWAAQPSSIRPKIKIRLVFSSVRSTVIIAIVAFFTHGTLGPRHLQSAILNGKS